MITAELPIGKLIIQPLWNSQDGRRHKISEMDASHVANCIGMLERNKSEFTDALSRQADENVPLNPDFLAAVESYDHNIEVFGKELIRRDEED